MAAAWREPDGPKTFAEVVRARRGARSVREVALAAGLSPATLLHLERGATQPRLDTVVALAQALGVSASELVAEVVGGEADEDRPFLSLHPQFGDARATWTAIAGALLDELDQRRAGDALRFVDLSVLTELTRLCVTRVRRTALILLARGPAGVKQLVVDDLGTEIEVTPVLLSDDPDREDLVRLRAQVKAVTWSAAPGKAFIVFASWAPDSMLQLAENALSGLRAAAPGSALASRDGEASCVARCERAGVRVVVAAVGAGGSVSSAG